MGISQSFKTTAKSEVLYKMKITVVEDVAFKMH